MLTSLANVQNAQEALVIPHHVAIIMDGNGRWAKKRGMLRLMGHRQGAQAVTRTVEASVQLGVKVLTLFAFSSENWQRPAEEVSGLMALFAKVLKTERERLHQNNIQVHFIGDISRFSDKLICASKELEELTAANDAMTLNIAINYGGRWDVAQAARRLAEQVQQGTLKLEDINAATMQQSLSVIDDVDLLIRTGGEYRLSNFLLFQCAYSEFYVTDTLWPDFGGEDLKTALVYFSGRERRFGKTSEQISVSTC